jgi:hypothetical protein
MPSTIRDLGFGIDFDCKTRTLHSRLKLIFLAASNLAQLTQRSSTEGNPTKTTGPPHFLHLAGSFIATSFIII